MYIQPNSMIKLLRGVPLDPTYENTWLPKNAGSQATLLSPYVKYTLNDQTYQRVNKQTLRIQIPADNIYDCNYLMFRNTSFGTKWFYAFIKKVEYVNNLVSEVEYEIDDMQTWLFDWDYEYCYIERMTEPYDKFGDNVVPEELDIGHDYFKQPYPGVSGNDVINLNDLSVCVLITRNVTGQSPVASQTINNVYTPLRIIKGLDPDAPSLIDIQLNQYQEDEILVVYEYPSVLDTTYPNPYSIDRTIQRPTLIGAYTPKNKKLYSYPFCKIIVSNNAGQVADYKWEHFDNPDLVKFRLKGVFVTSPEFMLYPINYNSYAEAFDEGIVLGNFPQCAWSGDTFKAWWAQNKASFVTSTVTSAISAIAAPAAAGAAGGLAGVMSGAAVGLLSAGGQVANSMAKVQDIKNTPSQTHGQTQTECLNAGIGRIQYNIYCVHIKPEIAKRIDSYFDKYGYAQHYIGTPIRDYRPHWSYVKTIGCEIKPLTPAGGVGDNNGLPADAMTHITQIHDKGITFWKQLSEIGNYGLDNSPPTPNS